eukprot:g15047.t1
MTSGTTVKMASRLLFCGALLQLAGPTLGSGKSKDKKTGNLNGCAKQGLCLDVTIESVDDTCDLSGNCFYKACMTINLGDDTDADTCPKENQESFSHICDQSDDTSSCPLDADDPMWDDSEKQSQGDHVEQCQIGAAGDTLQFLYKDGDGCDGDGISAFHVNDADGNEATVTCRKSTSYDFLNDGNTCSGNGAGKECIWEIELPPVSSCPTPTCPAASDFSVTAGLATGEFCLALQANTFDLSFDNFPAGAEKVTIQVVDENGDEILNLGDWTSGTLDIQAALEFEELVYFAFTVLYPGCDTCDPVVVSLTPCNCGFDDNNCPSDMICCANKNQCDEFDPTDGAEACGDPHMTGFLGQKFDFTGQDGGWYALIADDNMQVNMRVTCPVPDLPEITYITGLSVLATDANGFDHSVVIEVKDPHIMDSSCPAEVSPCLAEGSLRVTLDGKETLLAPGTVSLSPDVQVSAVNLPGACRSFGFEKYWELKQLQNARVGRRLSERLSMGEWVLADPTATNMDECMEYVARANLQDGGLFAHQSEHASFQIVTPAATVRLSHGRLHQIAMRDPTDQYDLPDHVTWQMNMAIDHTEVNHNAKGVLGETFVPTRDADGKPIMTGMEAIRGTQEDYRVDGALGMDFVQDAYTS